MALVITAEERATVVRHARLLQSLTIGWNSAEFVVAVVAGLIAGSVALVGFGVDSAIEVTSSLAAVWRLHHEVDEARRERAERASLRVIGACFLLLAISIAWEAIGSLGGGRPPDASLVGIAVAAASLVVMPILVRLKRRVARQLSSGALEAESRQTEVCAYLSAILVVGLGLNAWLGWWWADPAAGLVMVPLVAQEGWEAVRGKTCCAH
jgi:divalent metal cation (Fe/Co/Zn/Cd) transporter